MRPVKLTTIEGGSKLRTPSIAGVGTPAEDLQVGMPFLLQATAFDSDPDKQRWIRTSPITKITVVQDTNGQHLFICTVNSIYELEYLES